MQLFAEREAARRQSSMLLTNVASDKRLMEAMIEVETLTTKVEEQKKHFELEVSFVCMAHTEIIDDLQKSRGLHSVSAYRHGLYIYIYRSRPVGVAQSRHAFVGGTVSTWAR